MPHYLHLVPFWDFESLVWNAKVSKVITISTRPQSILRFLPISLATFRM